MNTQIDTAELRRLWEAATKGKWEVTRFMNIVTTPAPDDGGDIVTESPNRYVLTSFEKWQSNAEYIAAAHNALPALLDELEAAREEIESMRNDRDGALYFIRLNGHELQHADDTLRARDRHQKLIGAAEELERINAEFEAIGFSGLRGFTERAAKLRQEAL